MYGSRDLDDTTYCSEQYNVGSTEDMEHWTVHEKSFDGNDVPWIHDKKEKDYPVTDMDLKNPTPMFQHMISTMPAFIRFLIKISGKKNLNMGKLMPNQRYVFAPDCIEKRRKIPLFCMTGNSEALRFPTNRKVRLKIPVQMPSRESTQ